MHSNKKLQEIKAAIEPFRQQIINHQVYTEIDSIEDLKIFMQHHVFAVWDFMSLLKTLQNNLTCTSIPWFPKGSADIRYLINEIVIGEESDVDMDGNRKSHFELYLDAMHQCGASTFQINNFINLLKKGSDFKSAYFNLDIPSSIGQFMDFTFNVINSNKDYLHAAIFTFGREDLIPGMFMSMINDMNKKFPDSISIFKYYLERHIEVDGEHHSHLAMEMVLKLCGNNNQFWDEAREVTIESLKQRINLWNGALREIRASKKERHAAELETIG